MQIQTTKQVRFAGSMQPPLGLVEEHILISDKKLKSKKERIMSELGKEMADCFDKVINEAFDCKKGLNHCVSGFGDCENQCVYMGMCIYYKPAITSAPTLKQQRDDLLQISQDIVAFDKNDQFSNNYLVHVLVKKAKAAIAKCEE